MGAVNHAFAIGNFIHVIYKDGALLLKLLDHKAVVDDLFADIDGRTKGFESDPDDVNGPNHASAKAPRF